MSAMPIALLVTTAATGAVDVAVLRTLMVLRRHGRPACTPSSPRNNTAPVRGLVPAARPALIVEEIRAAVAEALAEERERELAEARAFWARRGARDASSALAAGAAGMYLFLPRQADFVAAWAGVGVLGRLTAGSRPQRPGTAPNWPRPPSPPLPPGLRPVRSATGGGGDHERTRRDPGGTGRSGRRTLADVRPGPPSARWTSSTSSPRHDPVRDAGHRETAERLSAACARARLPCGAAARASSTRTADVRVRRRRTSTSWRTGS